MKNKEGSNFPVFFRYILYINSRSIFDIKKISTAAGGEIFDIFSVLSQVRLF